MNLTQKQGSNLSISNPLVERQKNFVPPYCPNIECPEHLRREPDEELPFFRVRGWRSLKRYPHLIRCYSCRFCNRKFSYASFKLFYRDKRWGLNFKIFKLRRTSSYRQVARDLGVSDHLVRLRKKKMARWAYLIHMSLSQELEIEEAIVYDGLENFSGSQYDPNNINHAIGQDSLFVYDFGYCPLNRKGRMSLRQRKRKSLLEALYGSYPSKAIRTNTKEVIERLYQRKKSDFTLISDRHFQYARVVDRDLNHCQIKHRKIDSKVYRNSQNPLHPINHMDILVRQHIPSFRRETIAFAKKPNSMIDDYMLFVLEKNYMWPQFVKPQKTRPKMTRQSPAMALGICNRLMKFHELFDIKPSTRRTSLSQEWLCFYEGKTRFQSRPASPKAA